MISEGDYFFKNKKLKVILINFLIKYRIIYNLTHQYVNFIIYLSLIKFFKIQNYGYSKHY